MRKLQPQRQTIGITLVTTPLLASDEVIKTLMFKYLKTVYPISRVKLNGKFRRTIQLNGENYSVSENKYKFIPILISDIASTFAVQTDISKSIIFEYFNIENLGVINVKNIR